MDEQNLDDYLDYSDYYSSEHIQGFGLCEQTHLREFGRTFQPTVYSTVAILGILANSMLIFIFIKHADIRKIPALCMAISDLLFAATLPFYAVYANISQWIFGQSACKILTFLYIVTLYSSNFSLAFMALDKYYSVVSGFCCLRIKRISVKNMAAFFVLIFSLVASIPHVYFIETLEYDGHQLCSYHHVPAWRTFMKFEDNIAGFVVPFVIMSVCSALMTSNMIKTCPNKWCSVLKQEMAFVVTFFVLWLPYNVIMFMLALQELHIILDCFTHQNLHLAVQLTECLAFTHAFVNPLLYSMQNRRIRKLFKTALRGTPELLLESSENPTAVELTEVQTAGTAS